VAGIRSIGGAAASPLWLQIKADVLGKPVRSVAAQEVACLGAALVAAATTGAFAGLDEGVAAMVCLRDAFEPNPAHAEVYRQGYGRYLELYDRLAPMFR
jgi:xylulokinase